MPTTAQRPPAPPKPKGTSHWDEGLDYAWDAGYEAWVHEQPDGAIIVWMADEGIFISEEDFLAEQAAPTPSAQAVPKKTEGAVPLPTTGQQSKGRPSIVSPPWWDEEGMGPIPTVEYTDGTTDIDWESPVVVSAFKAYLEAQEVDEGKALQDAIAEANEAAIEAAQSGDTQAARQASQRLADLKAQYAQWQQSIQPAKTPPSGAFATQAEALAEVNSLGKGYEAVRDPQTGQWFVREKVPSGALSEGEARAEARRLGAGYEAYRDPATGQWFVEKKSRRTADQMILDFYEAGEFDKAFALDTFLDEIERPRGLTPYQAATLIMGLAVAPDEAREWIDALTSDWNSTRSPEERVESPGKALLPTAEERNAMPSQAAPAFGAGIPAGLGGAGAGGLQFPDWMTKPGGMPPGAQFGLTDEQKAALGQQEAMLEEQGGGPALTPAEIEARKGVFQGAPATTTTKAVFDPVAASLAQTYPDMDSAYRVGMEMQGRTGKEYRVVQKEGGYGLIEAPTTTTKSIYDPLDDKEEGGVPPTGDGTTEQAKPWEQTLQGALFETSNEAQYQAERNRRITAYQQMVAGGLIDQATADEWIAAIPTKGVREEHWLQGGWRRRPDGSMYNPQTHELVSPGDMQGRLEAERVPALASTPPASATLYYPGEDVYELTDEERARVNAQAGQQPAFSTPTTPPQFQAGQTAAFKRGDIAQFERGLFDTPKPLSIQDTLQQMLYKKWQQKQQAAFKARPVQRSVFK